MRTPRPLTGSQATTATCTGATRHHGIHISDHEVVHITRQTGVAIQTATLCGGLVNVQARLANSVSLLRRG